MKHGYIFLRLVGLLTIFITLTCFAAGEVVVSGAGTSAVNGTYDYQGTFDGKHWYLKAGGGSEYIFWDGTPPSVEWIIDNGSGYAYTNLLDSEFPPQTGWIIDTFGSSPAPTLSGSETSLSVELASFTAVQKGTTVLLEWATESETDNLGYILERKTNEISWEKIASYETNMELRGQGNISSRTKYTFTDNTIPEHVSVKYRLSDVDSKGKVTIKSEVTVNLTMLPSTTELHPAYPNPFNPTTQISFTLAQDAFIDLGIFNILGKKIKTIIGDNLTTAGAYSLTWNGSDDMGNVAPAGTYFVVLKTGNIHKVQKVVFLK